MSKPSALSALLVFISAICMPAFAAGEASPDSAMPAGGKAPAPADFTWLGDFDPPHLTQPGAGVGLPVIRTLKPTPLSPSVTSDSLPTKLLGDWDVTSTRENMETAAMRWTEIQWMFQRYQIAVWRFESRQSHLALMTSRPAISSTVNVERLKDVYWDGRRMISFGYEYEVNSLRVSSSVTLRLSVDGQRFSGIRRISVMDLNKHVTCATMSYILQGHVH